MGNGSRRLTAVSVAIAGLAAALLGGAPASRAAGAIVPVFNPPVTVDAQRLAGEPDLAVGSDNRTYVSAPWGVSTDTTFFWRSEDGATSFRQIQAVPGDQNPYPFRGGGDTEILSGPPAAPGKPARLYFANQNNLDSNTCGYSDDAGRTFQFMGGGTGGAVCPQKVGADRQWLARTRIDPAVAANGGDVGHDINYLWYDHFGQGTELDRSNDGQGYNVSAATSPISLGNPGNVVADPDSGVVYAAAPGGAGLVSEYSADGGKTLVPVDAVSHLAGSGATDFNVLAIDTAGNLYMVYSVQAPAGRAWQTFIVHTTGFTSVNNGTRTVRVAGGKASQWSAPVPLTGPGSARPDITYSVFPWMVAGDPGRVDVVFYGTSMPLTYDPNSQDARWTTYMVQGLDALGVQPTFTTSTVSEGPSHLHSICFNGIGCTGQGNRNLLDFFEVRSDPRGAAEVVYNDDANSLVAAFPGGPFVMVAKQVGGPSLYNSVGDLGGQRPPDRSEVFDAENDGFLPTNDTSTPALDLLSAGAVLQGSTLRVHIRARDLSNPVPALPPTEGASGVTYLLTWKWNDDTWYAAAHFDAANNVTYDAGRPQSVPFTGTGGPKFAAYVVNSNSTSVPGTVDRTHGDIFIEVPTAAVGGIGAGARMLQATAFTLADRGTGVLSDQADATPPFDDLLGSAPAASSPSPTAPTTPAPPSPTPPLPNTARQPGTGLPPVAILLVLVPAGALLVGLRRLQRPSD
ncbi:MAG: hypothetical protein ACYDGR_11125 [Candidatus Dormibacteria bacterium]